MSIVWEEIIGDNWVAERDGRTVGIVFNLGDGQFSAFANLDRNPLGHYATVREAQDAVEAAITERVEVVAK